MKRFSQMAETQSPAPAKSPCTQRQQSREAPAMWDQLLQTQASYFPCFPSSMPCPVSHPSYPVKTKVDLAQGIFFLTLKTKFVFILAEGNCIKMKKLYWWHAPLPSDGEYSACSPSPQQSCSDLPWPWKVLPLSKLSEAVSGPLSSLVLSFTDESHPSCSESHNL